MRLHRSMCRISAVDREGVSNHETGAGAHGIDTDASGGIFKSSTFGEADHAVFGGMVDSPAGDADEASDRRIVHDHATFLLAHLEQFVLHAEPHAAEIDRIHA